MTLNNSTFKSFKVLLVGDSAVGKTTFMKRHRTGEFDRRYNSTMAADLNNLQFRTDKGYIKFDVLEVAGQEKIHPEYCQKFYYQGADAAIIMFSVDSRLTYRNVANWYRDIKIACGDIPIVIVGNKVDMVNPKVKSKNITFHQKKNLSYVDVSIKTYYHIDKPFLHLSKMLINASYFVSYNALSDSKM